MDKKLLIETKNWIQDELFEYCLPFWLENGVDKENGGVYTCLDREGKLYSTDKSVWMQGRCGYIFSYLCNEYGVKKQWLEFSKSCIDFLEEHCIDKKTKRLYFTVTNIGEPLRLRRYFFSEAFYIIANAEYYKTSGDKEALYRAREYYNLLYNLNNGLIVDPVGLPPKTIKATRSGRALATPMIYLNVTSVMRRCDKENHEIFNKRAKECVDLITNYHFKPEIGYTLENVGVNGEYNDGYSEGRFVNPGHDMECSWFLMNEAILFNDNELFNKAKQMFDMAINKGWDKEHGGVLYFIDSKNCPPENYEHDMKLWWPHNEALIASLTIYKHTKDEKYFELFLKILDYCKKVFSDREYGEWYGYLRRDGKPTEPSSKGTTFKGPFHLPRMLCMCDKMLSDIIDEQI